LNKEKDMHVQTGGGSDVVVKINPNIAVTRKTRMIDEEVLLSHFGIN